MNVITKQQVAYYNSGPDAVVQMNGMIAQGWTLKQPIMIDGGFIAMYEMCEIQMSKEQQELFAKSLTYEYNNKKPVQQCSQLELNDEQYLLYENAAFNLNTELQSYVSYIQKTDNPLNYNDWRILQNKL